MGFLDLFGKSKSSPVQKHAERARNKRAQAPDRWDSIQALASMGTSEAVEALLPRFTFYVDPSITDQEEKEAAFDGVVRAGEAAVEPVTRFLERTGSVRWPLKMLDALVSPEEVITRLLDVLQGMDTEYERDPQRKIQILATLEERRDPRIVEAATRFLDDANETARFHAVGAILAQEEADAAREALLECFEQEESLRVRVRIVDGFVQREWSVGRYSDGLQSRLPKGYSVDKQGRVKKA